MAPLTNVRSQVPESRFNVSDYTNPSNSKLNRSMKAHTGNFLVSASSFDAKFFKISPREARSMDPQQRVLLQASYEALENAGYVPDATPSFQKESIGCYVGVATRDYAQNLRDDIDVYYSTGMNYLFSWGFHRSRGLLLFYRHACRFPQRTHFICHAARRSIGDGRHGLLVLRCRDLPGLPGAWRRGLQIRSRRRGQRDHESGRKCRSSRQIN